MIRSSLRFLPVALIAGCVVSSEAVPGRDGKEGASPFVLEPDGAISYVDGPVGIGTTGPTRLLDVGDNVAGHGRVGVYNLSTAPNAAEVIDIAAGSDGSTCALQLAKFAPESTEQFLVPPIDAHNWGALFTSACGGTPGGLAIGTNGAADPLVLFTHGEKRAVITPAGDVGIGAVTPPLSGPGVTRALTVSAGATSPSLAVLELQGAITTGVNNFGDIRFFNGATEVAAIAALRDTDDKKGALWLYTSDGNDLASRIVIQSNGFVGIGTQQPSATLDVGGNIHATGSITPGSSRELKTDIRELQLEDASTAVAGLRPVRFRYKAHPAEEQVGFIAEDVPELVSTNDRKGVAPMDVTAVLTRVVQAQQLTISEQKRTIDLQQRKLDDITSRLERLERQSQRGPAVPTK